MPDFNCVVLRERFTIADETGQSAPVIALSNRVQIDLFNDDGKLSESYVLRGHMLHTVVRLAGTILNTFARTGPLMARNVPVDFDQLWDMSAGGHERAHNPNLWVAIYHDGKAIYESGERHPFFDVIEQCDRRTKGTYENAVLIAEELFEQAGKDVGIRHDSNVACTFQITPTNGRVALVLRGAEKTTTFVFNGEKKEKGGQAIQPVHFINVAAAFLEGIQLSFNTGQGNEKLRRALITAYSPEGRELTSGRARLGELNAAIRAFENLHNVHYRPEKPEFSTLVINAEGVTAKRLDQDAIDAAQETETG
jgi:hypothetical protein